MTRRSLMLQSADGSSAVQTLVIISVLALGGVAAVRMLGQGVNTRARCAAEEIRTLTVGAGPCTEGDLAASLAAPPRPPTVPQRGAGEDPGGGDRGDGRERDDTGGASSREVPDTGFADSASGHEPQWELDHDLALIANDVYNNPEGPASIGEGKWSRVSDDDLRAAGIDPATLDDPDTGFRAGVYTDGEGRYVVAFAGTRDGTDWMQNLKQGVGLPAEQYDQAVALARQSAEAFGGGNVVFTGHSLGGGLASTAALAVEDSAAVTMNAAGVSPATFYRLHLNPFDTDVADGRIRRYNVENEPLTGMQEDFPGINHLMPDAVGYEITLENPGGAFENPLTSHGMDTVLAAMDSRDVKVTEGDGLVTHVLEDNHLVLGGHSVNDVLQTGGDILSSINPFG